MMTAMIGWRDVELWTCLVFGTDVSIFGDYRFDDRQMTSIDVVCTSWVGVCGVSSRSFGTGGVGVGVTAARVSPH